MQIQFQIEIENQIETDKNGLLMRVWDSVTASPGYLLPWEGTMSIMVIRIMIEKRRTAMTMIKSTQTNICLKNGPFCQKFPILGTKKWEFGCLKLKTETAVPHKYKYRYNL